jgi:hypothetical protein
MRFQVSAGSDPPLSRTRDDAALRQQAEKKGNPMSIFHSSVTMPTRRGVLREKAELILKISTALLITLVAGAVLLRAELYLSRLAGIPDAALTADEPH